ncbi:MAG: tetratricopeptide repeat protein, partial [Planctomycetota bacterium]
EILTGTRFLTRQQSLLSIDNIATGNWDPPADRLADSAIDEELKSLCVACLSHDRSGRPASAEEVATTIAEYQASVQTRLKKSEIEKASLLIRTSEQQKRFRIVGMLSAMIAVVSLIGIVAFGFANQRYRQAARKASIELKTRKELGDFFVLDFIQNANPEIQPDNNLKVKTLLGRAAKQVGKRFSHRPEIEREIRQNLALSFAGLGEFHQAKQQAEIVLQRCQEDLGPESLETWEAKLALATIESRLDSSGSTMDAIQEIEERFKNATGDGREFYFHARLLRASTLISQSQFDKANQIVDELEDQFDLAEDAELQSQLVDLLIRKAIAQLELANYSECRKIISKIYAAVPSRKFFNEQGDLSDNADLRSLQHYIICKNIEGNLLEYEGNFKESESLYENLLKIEKPLLGSEHPLTLNILHNMSMSKMKLGKIKESLDLLKPLGPISIRSLGESQEDSIRIRNAIASCHTMLGNTKEAIDEFKSLENVLTQLHRQPHHDVISNYHNQGELHRKIGNLKESERYLTMALKDSTSLFGIEHPRTLVTLAGLAHTHAKQKKFDVAETEYLKALQASYQILGKQHPDSLITLDDLCRMYRDSGQFEKAAQRLAEQLAIRKSFAPDANETISTAGNLGATYCRIEEFEKAIPLLEKSVKHRRENMGPENPRTLSRVRTLIKAYLGNDEFESIVKLTDEQISLIQSLHRPFDQNRLKAYRGYAQFRLGKAEAAESDLLGAYRWFEENPNQDKRSSEATFVKKQLAEYLIELYVSLGEDDSRDFWQSEFERIRNE